jgi:selenium metabolism protein YedF
MKTLDMRGQPCPIPVVNAKKALAEQNAAGVKVVVDNIVAVQNLEKMAKGTGCDFSYTEDGQSTWTVTITRNGAGSEAFIEPPKDEPAPQKTLGAAPAGGLVVLVPSDCMGRGSEELGKMLIKGFIFSLTQLDPMPQAVIFLNGGARLTTKGANTVPDLKTLEDRGVKIFTCGTCANYYKLTESLAVGSIVDMLRIVQELASASKVISI